MKVLFSGVDMSGETKFNQKFNQKFNNLLFILKNVIIFNNLLSKNSNEKYKSIMFKNNHAIQIKMKLSQNKSSTNCGLL